MNLPKVGNRKNKNRFGTLLGNCLCGAFLIFLVLLMPLGRDALAEGDTPAGDTAAAETVETVETGDPAANGESTDTGEDGGTVTIAGVMDGDNNVTALPAQVFEGDGTNNVLQQAIDAALKIAKEGLSQGAVIVTVGSGTYADDITIALPDNADTLLANKLVLVAADAYSLDDAMKAVFSEDAASGSVKVNGNIDIDSLDVLLFGIYLSNEKRIKAKDCVLDVTGTVKDDSIHVEIESGEDGSFALGVNGGAGNDVITVKQYGEDYTLVTADMPVAVDGGEGDDSIDVSLDGRQRVTANIRGGDGSDTISVSAAHRWESGGTFKDVRIDAGDGNNTVSASMKKNRTDFSIRSGAGNDTVTVTADKDAKACALSIVTGAGNDRITLDTSLANAVSAVPLDAGAGLDTLRLTGSLSTSAMPNIQGDSEAVTLISGSDKSLTLTLGGSVEVFLDELKNKKSVNIASIDADGCALDASGSRITPVSFITYLYSAARIDKLILQNPLEKLILAMLTIAYTDGDGRITIGSITAAGMTLLVSAKEITVTGSVSAEHVYLNAFASDSIYTTKQEGKVVPISEGGSKGEKFADELVCGFPYYGRAKITVGSGASVCAAASGGVVELSAALEFTRALLDLAKILSGMNFVNIKLCSATVDVEGTVKGELVRLSAGSTVSLEASNSTAAILCVPVAVSVGIVETGVRVHGGAEVQAAGEAAFSAAATVKSSTVSGSGQLPLSFAVSVIDSEVYCRVEGSASVQSGGGTSLRAEGAANVTTRAEKGSHSSGISGGYFAVAVVTQDVRAGIFESASVLAGGKLDISAKAKEVVKTSAVSAEPDVDLNPDDGAFSSLSDALNYGKKLLGTLGRMGLEAGVVAGAEKLTKAQKKIDGKNHSVSLSNAEHGSVASSAVKADAGDTVTLTVSSDKDFALDTLTVTYKDATDNSEKTITPVPHNGSSTVYTFTMPGFDVTVKATFKESKGSGGNNGGGSGSGNSIQDIVNQAAASNSDANRALRSEKYVQDTAAKKITVQSGDNGTAALDILKFETQNDIYVLPTKSVRVVFTPNEHYALEGLTATYKTKTDGGAETEHTIVITQNANGEYVFIMPAADVTVKATFREGSGEEAASASSTQLTGALAVTVAENGSVALVETAGTVRAGGAMNVAANTATETGNLADATANGGHSNPSPQEKNDDEIATGMDVTEHLVVNELVNGMGVRETTGCKDETDAAEYRFEFEARLGYELETVMLKYKGSDGKEKSFALQKVGDGDGAYYRYLYGQEYIEGAWCGKSREKGIYSLAYGAKYEITATFKKQSNSIVVTADEGSGGAVIQVAKLTDGEGGHYAFKYTDNPRQSDYVVFTLKPAEGYAVNKTYTVTATYEGGSCVLKKSDDGLTYGFEMPNAVVTLKLGFIEKTNAVNLTVQDKDGAALDKSVYEKYISLSDKLAVALGETFTVTLTEQALLEGLRLTVEALSMGGAGSLQADAAKSLADHRGQGLSILIPDGVGSSTLNLTLKLIEATHAVSCEADNAGNIVSAPKRTNAGDTMLLKPKAADGYQYVSGTLKVTVTMADGSTVSGAAAKAKNGTFRFTLPNDTAKTIQSIRVEAEFKEAKGQKGSKTSVGVGIGVSVLFHEAIAALKSGTLSAKGFSVKSNGSVNAANTAKAGYSTGDFGLAGSIAVSVVSAGTRAYIMNVPALTVGGGAVSVNASTNEKYAVNADSAGQKMQDPNSTGVGAAIAVNVLYSTACAYIEDNANITPAADKDIAALSVSAVTAFSETMQAKAGSSGGTAVTPVIAVDVSETDTRAWVGGGSTALNVAGGVSVTAGAALKRACAANASAAGESVGVGASFVVTYIKDRAKAQLLRSVSAKNVTVQARGTSTMKGTSRAGAKGAKSAKADGAGDGADDGEADKQAGGALKAAQKLGGKSTNESDLSKQKSETSEGSISVAAAFVLNIQTHLVESVIDGGVIIDAPAGDVKVLSIAQLDCRLSANGSATVAKIGVGVAVAIHVVTYENLAHIDNAAVIAKNLTVTATIPAEAAKAVPEDPASENYIYLFVSGLAKKYLTELLSGAALAPFRSLLIGAAELIIKAVIGENGENLKTLLAGSGLEPLVDQNPADVFMKNWDACFGELIQRIKHEDYENIKKIVKDKVISEVVPIVVKGVMTLIGAISDGFGDGGFMGALRGIAGLVVDSVKTFSTDAKSKAYWADKMSDLFIHTTKDLLNGIGDLEKLKSFVSNNLKAKVVENVKSYLGKMGMTLTNAALDWLSSQANLTLKPEQQAPAHTFFTYAIAGAGAFDVGVAGSAAIAVINGTTRAYIADAAASGNAVTVSGDAVLKAYSVHRLETIASSAVGSNDEPDKHETSTGDGDTADNSPVSYTTQSAPLDIDGKKHELLLTTGSNVALQSREIKDGQDGRYYEIVYKASDGYQFTDDSLSLDGVDKALIEKVISDDKLTMTLKLKLAASLGDVFTLKVKGVAGDERDITLPDSITVTGPTKADIDVSRTKARKGDRVTVTITPETTPAEGDKIVRYKVDEENLKAAVANGLARLLKADDTELIKIDVYEVDAMGSVVLSFRMPDEAVKLALDFTKQGDKYIFVAQDPEEQAKTENGKGIGIGAAFSFAYTQFDTEAYIGKNRRVTSGTLWLDAEGGLENETIAVSGTDPIGTQKAYYREKEDEVPNDSVKKTSVDAGVAFAYLGGRVKTWIDEGASVATTGGDTLDVSKTVLPQGSAEDKGLAAIKVNLALTAREWSKTAARASAFTAGSATAVGACAAINYVDVASSVTVLGGISAAGTLRIAAESAGQDIARGMATAMGADMARYCKKFVDGAGSVSEKANKVTNGEAFNDSGKNMNNSTGKKIQTKLDGGDTKKTDPSAPVSTKATRSQNAGGDGTEAVTQGSKIAGDAGKLNPNQDEAKSSYQVAAAVSVNITAHKAAISILHSLTFGALDILAVNEGNFSALATGAAMSLAKKSNAVAAAVSVSVNSNDALITVADGISLTHSGEGSGRVTASASATQNITEEFSRYMTAQSLAGSVSGGDGDMTVSGAVSVVVSNAKTQTLIGKNVTITGGDISITATDKSRLAVRAGAISFSKGTSRGIGASFALIYANDALTASVGSGSVIRGSSLKVLAEKYSVNESDYTALDWRFLFTNSSDLTDTERARVQKGVIDVHKNGDTGGYDVDINISTDTVLELVELCNYFSAVNYYVEAISGTVTTGKNTKLALAGSFAMLFANSKILASLGENVQVALTGDAEVAAGDTSRTRVIGGSVAAGPAEKSCGLTVGFMKDKRQISAAVERQADIRCGSFKLAAHNGADDLVITVAAGIAASAQGSAYGGALTVAVVESTVEALVRDSVSIRATADPRSNVEATGYDTGSVRITASTDRRAMLISASANVAGSTAIGGTIAGLYYQAKTHAAVGDAVKLISGHGDVAVTADAKNWMMNILASASASRGGTNVSGAIGLVWDESDNAASVGRGAELEADSHITVHAGVDSTLLNIFVAAAFGGGTSVGETVLFNKLGRSAVAHIAENAVLRAASGNILVEARGTEWTLIIGVGAGVSIGGSAIAGVNGLTVSTSRITALVDKGCELWAGGAIAVYAHLDVKSYQVVGGAAVATGTASVGETVTVMTVENSVLATIADSVKATAQGLGGGVQTVNRQQKRRGVYVGATAQGSLLIVSVGVAANTSTAGVAGVVHVLYDKNTVGASVSDKAELTAEDAEGGDGRPAADVTVEADDDTHILDIAGGLAAAPTAGIGATALVVVFAKKVYAHLGVATDPQNAAGASVIRAAGGICVTARAADTLMLMALSFGIAGTAAVAAAASALKYENEVSALFGSDNDRIDTAEAGGSIVVSAASDETLVNIGATVAASGTAAVGGLAILTFFDGKTKAYIARGSRLTAGGDVSVTANSKEFITSDGVGAAASGTAAVGGVFDFVRTKQSTLAYTGSGVTLLAAGDIHITAKDDYSMLAIAGAAAGSGTAAVGAVVVLSMHYNALTASTGADSVLSARNIFVGAQALRTFKVFSAVLAGAGAAGIGVSVAALIVGGTLPQDVYDSAFGSGKIDPAAQISGLEDKCGVTLDGTDDLSASLTPDGRSSKDMGGSSYGGYVNGTTKGQIENGDTSGIAMAEQGSADMQLSERARAGYTDATQAVIMAGSRLTATGDIRVCSQDVLSVLMLSGSVAVGGSAGVGAGLSAAKLNSCAAATVESGAVLSAGGAVTVLAVVGTTDKDFGDTFSHAGSPIGKQTEANAAMKAAWESLKAAKLISDTEQKCGVWLLGAVATAGGAAGVGIAGGVLLFYTKAQALMNGTLERAESLTVEAQMNTGDVFTAVLGASAGGAVGVAVSVSVVYMEGAASAHIGKDAEVRGVSGSVQLLASGTGTLRTLALAAAVGGTAGVAVNVSVLLNRNAVCAAVDNGALIDAEAASLLVKASGAADMKALLITAAAGLVGVGASVLVCNGRMGVSASIGVPYRANDVGAGSIRAARVTVTSVAHTPVKTEILSVAAGAVAVGGVVSLAFGSTDNTASVRGVPLTVSGDVNITAKLTSETEVRAYTVTGGAVTVACIIAIADIRSVNAAYLETAASGAAIGGALNILTEAPGRKVRSDILVGASVGALVINFYVALAWNHAVNEAKLLARGDVAIQGNLTVSATGSFSCEASAKSQLSISGLSVSGTFIFADNQASLTAAIDMAQANLSAKTVSVQSETRLVDGVGVKTDMGSDSDIPEISLANAKMQFSDAVSRTSSTAAVSGTGALTAETLMLMAQSLSKAASYTRKLSVSFVSVMAIGARALVQDTTAAYVDAGNGGLTVTLQNDASIQSRANATAYAESITPLDISLVSIGSGSVKASIGESESVPHSISAYVGRNVAITAAGVTVMATNVLSSVTASMKNGYKFTAVNLESSTVPTMQYLNVFAGVGDGSAITASRGDVYIRAEGGYVDPNGGDSNVVTSSATVDGKSIGILISASKKYAENTVNQTVLTRIGQNAVLNAHLSLDILANANAEMTAETNSSSAGIFDGGDVTAKNTLTRSVQIEILGDALLSADFGDLTVSANCGIRDKIRTIATGSGKGLVSIGDLKSSTSVTDTVAVTVAGGATLVNTFGTVTVESCAALNESVSTGDFESAGLIAAPKARSFVNSVTMNMTVSIADGAVKQTLLIGRNIEVAARLKRLSVSAKSNAESYMLAGKTEAESEVTLYITPKIILGNVHLKAYEKLHVLASAHPESHGVDVFVRAQSYSGAVISSTGAYARLKGADTPTLLVRSGARLTGSAVALEAEKFNGTVTLEASARKAAIGWRNEVRDNSMVSTEQVTVDGGTVFHIADGAAGIVIDFYFDEKTGELKERCVGMPDRATHAKITLGTPGTISLYAVTVKNVRPGTLSVPDSVDISACRIYGQQYIGDIQIWNHTDYTLILGAIRTYNPAFTRSAVTAKAFSDAYQHLSPEGFDRPTVTVCSYRGGNVTLSGWIPNERGTVAFIWTGDAGDLITGTPVRLGDVLVAPVWANRLLVTNARSVGTEAAPLESYLADVVVSGSREAAAVSISASGAAYLVLSLSELIPVDDDALPQGLGVDRSAINGRLNLDGIAAANLTMRCGTPFRMYYLAKAEAARIILPGDVEFTTETVTYEPDSGQVGMSYMFRLEDLARYATGSARVMLAEEAFINLSCMELPNGMILCFIADDAAEQYGYAKGELYEIRGAGLKFDTARYYLVLNASSGPVMELRDYNGAVVDLTDGVITTAEKDGASIYIGYDADTQQWQVCAGDEVVKESVTELYRIRYERDADGKYVYGPDGKRILVDGTKTLEAASIFELPHFIGTYRVDGQTALDNCTFYRIYENGPGSDVAYVVLDSSGAFVGVVNIEDAWVNGDERRETAEDDELTMTIENYNGSGYTYRATVDYDGDVEHGLYSGDTKLAEPEAAGGYWRLDYKGLFEGLYWDFSAHFWAATDFNPYDYLIVEYTSYREKSFGSNWTETVNGGSYSEDFGYTPDSGSMTIENFCGVTGLTYYIRMVRSTGSRFHYDTDTLTYNGVLLGASALINGYRGITLSGGQSLYWLLTGTGGTFEYEGFRVRQYDRLSTQESSLSMKSVAVEPIEINENHDGVEYHYTYYAYRLGMRNGQMADNYSMVLAHDALYYISRIPKLDKNGQPVTDEHGKPVEIEQKFAMSYATDRLSGKMSGTDGFSLTGDMGAYVHLGAGGNRLRLFGGAMDWAGETVTAWRIGAGFWLSADGEVYLLETVTAQGTRYVRYKSNLRGDGSLWVGTQATDTDPVKTAFLLNYAQDATRVIILGDIHMELLADAEDGRSALARDVMDSYYYYDDTDSKWVKIDKLTRGGSPNYYTWEQGTGDLVVYLKDKLAFRIHTSGENGAVHSVYDKNGLLRYSVDEQGNVFWGNNDDAATALPVSVGSGPQGGYVAEGDMDCSDLTVEAGAILLIDAQKTDSLHISNLTLEDASGGLAGGQLKMASADPLSGDVSIEDAELGKGSQLALNAAGNIDVGALYGEDATLTLHAGGALHMDDVMLSGDRAALSAGGDLVLERSDLSDCDAVSLAGRDVKLPANAGDLKLARVDADRDVLINTSGSILDVSGNPMTALMRTLAEKQAALDAALRGKTNAEKALKEALAARTKAQEALDAAEEALRKADPNNQSALDAAQKRVDAARAAKDEADRRAAEAELDKQAADAAVTDSRGAVDAARTALEAAGGEATLSAGGHVTLNAGGAIGAPDAPLLIDADGRIDMEASGPADLYTPGDAHIGSLSAGSVSLTSGGGIDAGGGSGVDIQGGAVDLWALGGSIGADGRPVNVAAGSGGLSASGENVFLRSKQGIRAGNITAHGEPGSDMPNGALWIWTDGSFTQQPDTQLVYGTLFLHKRDGEQTDAPMRRRTLSDVDRGVYATSYFTADAALTARVSTQDALTLETGCDACKILKGALTLPGMLAAYRIAITGGHAGPVCLELLPAGLQDGQELYALCCVDGRLVVRRCTVKGGAAAFDVDGQNICLALFTDRSALSDYLKTQGLSLAALLGETAA